MPIHASSQSHAPSAAHLPLCEQSAAVVHGVRVRVGSDWPETTASSPCGDHAPSVMP